MEQMSLITLLSLASSGTPFNIPVLVVRDLGSMVYLMLDPPKSPGFHLLMMLVLSFLLLSWIMIFGLSDLKLYLLISSMIIGPKV